MSAVSPKQHARPVPLTLLALGVVFGDIGTSPLYSFETALQAGGGTPQAAIGVCSLIIWTLFFVVSIKYVQLVMRANYHGEGGIFALLALIQEKATNKKRAGAAITFLLIFGAALLFGDGAITPAISVLSAVEGIEAVHPALSHYTMPAAVFILLGLFFAQRFGTGRLGSVFGPVMLTWFLCIALAGVASIVQEPTVLRALHPAHGIGLLIEQRWTSFAIIGAVVLAITGAEALYADMGHFGRPPISRAWHFIVFPSLILNYLGQAALIQHTPSAATDSNIFFLLIPTGGLREGMVILATIATIVASQALISGVFSLSNQAIDMGFLPRIHVKHTDAHERGRIYIPTINFLLGFACLMLVVTFKNSEALAGAYGIAVTGAMIITTIAFACVVFLQWNRPLWQTVPLLALLLAMDFSLFGSCLGKLFEGGLVPVAFAVMVMIVMITWRRGRELVHDAMSFGAVSPEALGARLQSGEFPRTPTCQAFLVHKADPAGPIAVIMEQYRRIKVLGDQLVVLMLIASWKDATRPPHDVTVEDCGGGLWIVKAHYGYMREVNAPHVMEEAARVSGGGFVFDPENTFFVVSREIIMECPESKMPAWRRKLFAFLSRNILPGPNYLHIPAGRLIVYNWLLRL